MEFESILARISSTAESLTENDLDNLVKEVLVFYESRISAGATRAYGAGISSVARQAFEKQAAITIRNGLNTFLFTKEHWRAGRDLNTYLLTCLSRLAEQLYWDQDASKRTNVPVCPGCKELGNKVYLQPEARAWRCVSCTSEADRLMLDDRKGRIPATELPTARARMRLHKFFALHSRKGYRCPEHDCARFIPDSLRGEFGISCPYTDCGFFGDAEGLQEMAHPSAVGRRQHVSLNASVSKETGGSIKELGDFFEVDTIRADDQIAIMQKFKNEFSTLISVIDQQMESVRLMNSNATREQKLLMYEAFKSMCETHPEEMVSYLVHQSQSQEFPLQARIFQKFITLIEDSLPFSIEKHGEAIEIMSISDPDLGLFTGTSEFVATVDDEGNIPNNTIETYTGSRKYKNHGSYFIGRLIDIVDVETGNSVMSQVKSHSFIEIESTLPLGTKVKVTHYRIPPHYEMGAMVFLQRIRRHIVDKVYFRLNKVRREVGGGRKRTADSSANVA